MFQIQVPLTLLGYFERVAERSAVRQALAEEGLLDITPSAVRTSSEVLQ
jgi:hypothetical protein